MDFLNQYAAEIVLFFLTSVAFGLIIVVRLQRRKQDRTRKRAVDAFFGKNTPPATKVHNDDETTVKALLTQAIAGTQQAARTLNDIQRHLEAASTRIGALEDQLAHSFTHERIKNSVRPLKADLIQLANQVFGDPTKAAHWLNKPKRQFGGQTPMQMVETDEGARRVEELLYQIDHGMGA